MCLHFPAAPVFGSKKPPTPTGGGFSHLSLALTSASTSTFVSDANKSVPPVEVVSVFSFCTSFWLKSGSLILVRWVSALTFELKARSYSTVVASPVASRLCTRAPLLSSWRRPAGTNVYLNFPPSAPASAIVVASNCLVAVELLVGSILSPDRVALPCTRCSTGTCCTFSSQAKSFPVPVLFLQVPKRFAPKIHMSPSNL